MKSKLLAAIVAAGTCAAAAQTGVKDRPDRLEQQTMQQAIAFEKHKQAAADRQAKIEQRRANHRPALCQLLTRQPARSPWARRPTRG